MALRLVLWMSHQTMFDKYVCWTTSLGNQDPPPLFFYSYTRIYEQPRQLFTLLQDYP